MTCCLKTICRPGRTQSRPLCALRAGAPVRSVRAPCVPGRHAPRDRWSGSSWGAQSAAESAMGLWDDDRDPCSGGWLCTCCRRWPLYARRPIRVHGQALAARLGPLGRCGARWADPGVLCRGGWAWGAMPWCRSFRAEPCQRGSKPCWPTTGGGPPNHATPPACLARLAGRGCPLWQADTGWQWWRCPLGLGAGLPPQPRAG